VFELGRLGDPAAAMTLYLAMLPLLRWDTGPRFVEAIKHTLDLLGLAGGGPTRPPRRILEPEEARIVAGQLAAIQAVAGS
jgi:dihydrodipicolinate synthase/N-acetylneuraminate lyase